MSYLLPHLHSGYAVDQAILAVSGADWRCAAGVRASEAASRRMARPPPLSCCRRRTAWCASASGTTTTTRACRWTRCGRCPAGGGRRQQAAAAAGSGGLPPAAALLCRPYALAAARVHWEPSMSTTQRQPRRWASRILPACVLRLPPAPPPALNRADPGQHRGAHEELCGDLPGGHQRGGRRAAGGRRAVRPALGGGARVACGGAATRRPPRPSRRSPQLHRLAARPLPHLLPPLLHPPRRRAGAGPRLHRHVRAVRPLHRHVLLPQQGAGGRCGAGARCRLAPGAQGGGALSAACSALGTVGSRSATGWVRGARLNKSGAASTVLVPVP